MYKYLVAVIVGTPLIGIWMVEGGEYAGSVGVNGYLNGAGIAYSIYAIAVVVIATICAGGLRRTSRGWRPAGRGTRVEVRPRESDALFRRFSRRLLLVEVAFLLVFLFGFGAVDTWLGNLGKGEFRVGLGEFGAIPNSMSKFILPALVAYASLLYSRSSRSAALKWRLAANFLVVFVVGASWGFKTTAISGVLPALLLLYWRVRPIQLITLALIAIASFVFFFWIFDANVGALADVQSFLLKRITVLQGDVAWYIWGLHSSGAVFPSYWPTLLAGVGDKVLSVLGVPRSDYYQWMLYHYDWMVTYLADVPLEQIAEGGHTIVATPFAEGLIAGGLGGLAFFTVVAGVLTGRMYVFLDSSLQMGRNVPAALGATYCCYFFVPWLNAGAIVQLFHISLLFNIGGTLALLAVLRRRWVFGESMPRVAALSTSGRAPT
jgi:hypothetical protein